MPLRSRRKTLLAELETTYGVDPTPAAADAILVSELEIDPLDASYIDRDLIQPFFGHSEQYPDAASVVCRFTTELAGSAALGTPPPWGKLLRACGFAETINAAASVVYRPITDAIPSITLYYNIDGVLHELNGAFGDVDFQLSSRQLPKMAFEFRGLFRPVVDALSPTADFTAWRKPVPINTINTIDLSILGTTGLVMESANVKMNNRIAFQSLVGLEEVVLTDRKPEGQLRVRATTMSVRNWFADAQAATSGLFELKHGPAGANRVIVRMPKASLSQPQYSDLDGVQMLQTSLRANPNTGNDEIEIQCGAA
jgi:hypothetical protein